MRCNVEALFLQWDYGLYWRSKGGAFEKYDGTLRGLDTAVV